jgi:hypothetical protein
VILSIQLSIHLYSMPPSPAFDLSFASLLISLSFSLPSSIVLGTVQQRLSSGDYSSRAAFARDVRLVFSNAIHYNNPGDEVWELAQTLLVAFDAAWGSSALPPGGGGGAITPAGVATPANGPTPTTTPSVGGGADECEKEEDAIMDKAPTVRKRRRMKAPVGADTASPEANCAGGPIPVVATVEDPQPAAGVGKKTGSAGDGPKKGRVARDYSKAVGEGGWRGGALEVGLIDFWVVRTCSFATPNRESSEAASSSF